jgi:hypothetical protein
MKYFYEIAFILLLIIIIIISYHLYVGYLQLYEDTRWRSWLRYCRKVAGSIPHGGIDIFFDLILPAAISLWSRLSF